MLCDYKVVFDNLLKLNDEKCRPMVFGDKNTEMANKKLKKVTVKSYWQ